MIQLEVRVFSVSIITDLWFKCWYYISTNFFRDINIYLVKVINIWLFHSHVVFPAFSCNLRSLKGAAGPNQWKNRMNSTIFSFLQETLMNRNIFSSLLFVFCISILDVIMNISDPPLARLHSAPLSYILGSPFADFLFSTHFFILPFVVQHKRRTDTYWASIMY